MAAVVWFTVGVALWHFTVFVPDRFWGGIVGALLGAVAGAMVTGAIAPDRLRASIGETDIGTVLCRDPGHPARPRASIYALGVRRRASAGRGLSRARRAPAASCEARGGIVASAAASSVPARS